MIKHYQWTDFKQLKDKYKDNKELIEVIISLERNQRKIKFYEDYCVNDDILEKNRIKAQEAAEHEKDSSILADHIWNLTDDVEQLRRERDMYKSFLDELNNPNNILKKVL